MAYRERYFKLVNVAEKAIIKKLQNTENKELSLHPCNVEDLPCIKTCVDEYNLEDFYVLQIKLNKDNKIELYGINNWPDDIHILDQALIYRMVDFLYVVDRFLEENS